MSREIRLQKYIADCGVTSRRKAEELILQGRVEINGEVVTELGSKVNPEEDSVMVDGDIVDHRAIQKTYVLLHKPRGYMTTVSDPEGRPTVMDFVKEVPERIYPVGRLDYLSEGLLLMTNDGDMANKVMHPSFEVIKVYEVKVFGSVTEQLLQKLRAGVQTEDGFLKPKTVRVIKQLPTKTWLEFRLNEGKNREIRKICEACGLTVDKLKRVAIAGLTIEGIRPGGFRYLSKKDLMMALGIDPKSKKPQLSVEFISSKKTIDLKKKRPKAGTAADDPNFTKFRRETYFETLKQIKETKALKEKEERRAQWEEKEKAFQDRKDRKIMRQQKKESQVRGVHAKIIK